MSELLLIAQLESAILIKVTGKDSERYLNNRLSNNVKTLAAGGVGNYAAALSVQGKTEGLFYNLFFKNELMSANNLLVESSAVDTLNYNSNILDLFYTNNKYILFYNYFNSFLKTKITFFFIINKYKQNIIAIDRIYNNLNCNII